MVQGLLLRDTSSTGGGGGSIVRIHGSRYACVGECHTNTPGAEKHEDTLHEERVSREAQYATQGIISDVV